MHGEHPHSQQVGLTQVVDEAADVAKESGIDAVCVSHLNKMMTKKSHGHTCSLGLPGDGLQSGGLKITLENTTGVLLS